MLLKDLDDEIEELNPVTPEAEDVDTSGDREFARQLDELLKEKEEKKARAKHMQQLYDERLAQEMQLRLVEEERNKRKASVKVIEISSDSDDERRVVIKQEPGVPGLGTVKRASPELAKRARLPATHEASDSSAKQYKKVAAEEMCRKEKRRGRQEDRKAHKHKHKHKHARKVARSTSPPPSISPPSFAPPSVSPPSVSPPSVAPPSVSPPPRPCRPRL